MNNEEEPISEQNEKDLDVPEKLSLLDVFKAEQIPTTLAGYYASSIFFWYLRSRLILIPIKIMMFPLAFSSFFTLLSLEFILRNITGKNYCITYFVQKD